MPQQILLPAGCVKLLLQVHVESLTQHSARSPERAALRQGWMGAATASSAAATPGVKACWGPGAFAVGGVLLAGGYVPSSGPSSHLPLTGWLEARSSGSWGGLSPPRGALLSTTAATTVGSTRRAASAARGGTCPLLLGGSPCTCSQHKHVTQL